MIDEREITVEVTPMADITVLKNSSGERTFMEDLFESKDEYINANPAVFESVLESSTCKETDNTAPVTTSPSNATSYEEISYMVMIPSKEEVPVDSRNCMKISLVTCKEYSSTSAFEDVGWAEAFSLYVDEPWVQKDDVVDTKRR